MIDRQRPGRALQPARSFVFVLACCALLSLGACASGARPAPRIDRLPEATAATSAEPGFDKEALVAMVVAGATPEEVVTRWRRDDARLLLHAADIVDLARRGAPLPVLDAMLAAREQALRADADSRLVAAQAGISEQLAAQLAAGRARPVQCPASPCWIAGPWSGCSPGGWRGGFFRGW